MSSSGQIVTRMRQARRRKVEEKEERCLTDVAASTHQEICSHRFEPDKDCDLIAAGFSHLLITYLVSFASYPACERLIILSQSGRALAIQISV
jgi:hypothetical protein